MISDWPFVKVTVSGSAQMISIDFSFLPAKLPVMVPLSDWVADVGSVNVKFAEIDPALVPEEFTVLTVILMKSLIVSGVPTVRLLFRPRLMPV